MTIRTQSLISPQSSTNNDRDERSGGGGENENRILNHQGEEGMVVNLKGRLQNGTKYLLREQKE